MIVLENFRRGLLCCMIEIENFEKEAAMKKKAKNWILILFLAILVLLAVLFIFREKIVNMVRPDLGLMIALTEGVGGDAVEDVVAEGVAGVDARVVEVAAVVAGHA